MSVFRKLPAVDIAGSNITIKVPTGPTYDGILLIPSGTGATIARVENIRVLLNSKTVMEFATGTELDDINKYHGRDAADGTLLDLMLYFRRPEVQAFGKASTIDAERMTSLRTRNLSTFTIECTANASWTAPAMEAYALEAPFAGEDLGFLVKTKRYTYNPGASGDFEMSDWAKGPRIIAAHFKKSDVNRISIKTNGYAVIDNVSKDAIQAFQDQDGRVPVSGYTVADFCQNGNLDEALRTAGLTDLRATANLGSSGALPVIVEYLDTFEGI